jgi:hypothetical protein
MSRSVVRFVGPVLAGLLILACVDRADRPTGPAAPNARVEQAPQDPFAAVVAIQNRHTERLMAVAGVVGTATGLGANGRPAVLVFAAGPDVAGIPTTLEEAPVEIRVTGEFRALQGPPAGAGPATNLKSQIRPVPNGVSVSNNNQCAAGTLGAAVLQGTTQFALSNNHVFARENDATIGEPIVQPGRYDNKPKCANEVATDELGPLADFEPIVFSTTANNVMDAAVATATTPLTCATPADFYGSPGATPVAAGVGLGVQKVGRTSGLTTGAVVAINATVNVGYGSGIARFVGQIVTTPRFSRAGDSGSLIVTTDAANSPVGLLFAGARDGTTIANPIGPVLTRFDVTMCHI